MSSGLSDDIVSIKVTILVERDGDMFFGHCKEFPGVLVNEETETKCLNATREAIKEHLQVFLPMGKLKIPETSIVRKRRKRPSPIINSIEEIQIPAIAA